MVDAIVEERPLRQSGTFRPKKGTVVSLSQQLPPPVRNIFGQKEVQYPYRSTSVAMVDTMVEYARYGEMVAMVGVKTRDACYGYETCERRPFLHEFAPNFRTAPATGTRKS